ncbi:hypothetical protein DFR29_12411 [Tahibacter aquaticus]|uniref:Uncharacterized protein n=1 Tax=Tahibacter aquaticus TaxID=520092 RepID=A0A4R6YKQ3_9GAMM|nr:hypothetical protein DFR29_12411 [Tahibacter aquaticus]
MSRVEPTNSDPNQDIGGDVLDLTPWLLQGLALRGSPGEHHERLWV